MRSAALLRFFFVALLVGFGPRAMAQDVSAGVVRTQFVFLIDDSGSMKGVGGPAADPDRLAVFAVRSMLAMLDDQDEASVLSLNAEDLAPGVAPLGQNRTDLYELLASDGRIARYDGPSTPCSTALDRVWKVLEAARKPGVNQVLFFLTDGACDDRVVTKRWQERKRSGDFDFYYLRFPNRDSSSELAELAGRSNLFDIGSDDAGAMLKPLALALAQSQGYAAYHINQAFKGTIPAFIGSERVRVLAAARDGGRDLLVNVTKAVGRRGEPQVASVVDKGLFQYGDKGAHRFTSLRFTDEGVRTVYSVDGAGGGQWSAVIVPEYRLGVTVVAREGRCKDEGAEVESLKTGASACFGVRVKDAAGKDVTQALRDAGATVKYEWSVDGAPPKVVPASNVDKGTREQQNLERGVYTIRPLLYLTGDDSKPPVRGFPMSLTVSTQTIRLEPTKLDVGVVKLGGTVQGDSLNLAVAGNFEPTRVSVAYNEKQMPPACVRVTVDNNELPTAPLNVAADKVFQLAVSVPTWCGPSIPETVTFPLLFKFDAVGGGTGETQSVLVSVQPRGRLDLPSTLKIDLLGGGVGQYGKSTDGAAFTLRPFEADPQASIALNLAWQPTANAWPVEGLSGVFVVDDESVLKEDGSYADTFALKVGADAVVLPFMALATSCCGGGSYTGTLRVASADPPQGLKPYTHDIKVTVSVTPAGMWACVGGQVLSVLKWVALILFVAYIFNIFANWRRIPSPKVMESKIQILRYTGRGGSTTISMNDALHVRGAVNSATRFRKRVRAWVASNPFRAGLPGFLGGRTYYETLYVPIQSLASEHASTGVRTMALKPGLDMISRVKELRQDGVYIVARGGSSVSFYVVISTKDNPIAVSGTVAVPTKEGGRYYVLNQGCKVLPNLEPPRDNGPAGIQIA